MCPTGNIILTQLVLLQLTIVSSVPASNLGNLTDETMFCLTHDIVQNHLDHPLTLKLAHLPALDWPLSLALNPLLTLDWWLVLLGLWWYWSWL